MKRTILFILLVFSATFLNAHGEKKHDNNKKSEYSIENGKRIYYYGKNLKGEKIVPEGGPMWLINHGGSCVNCHNKNGEGNVAVMMCSKKSSNISYDALTSDEHMAGMAKDHSHDNKYNFKRIKNAIKEGVNPDGKRLNECMPKWKMSDKDLNDLTHFLKFVNKK